MTAQPYVEPLDLSMPMLKRQLTEEDLQEEFNNLMLTRADSGATQDSADFTDTSELLRELVRKRELNELRLYHITQVEFDALCDEVSKHPVNMLNLAEVRVKDWKPFADFLRSDETLDSLNLRHSTADLRVVSGAIGSHRQLRVLSVSGLEMRPEFFDAIRTTGSIVALNLARCDLSDCTELSKALGANCSLTHINLHGCRITKLLPILRLIKQRKISVLDISGLLFNGRPLMPAHLKQIMECARKVNGEMLILNDKRQHEIRMKS